MRSEDKDLLGRSDESSHLIYSRSARIRQMRE
jgi:hypothetical protein